MKKEAKKRLYGTKWKDVKFSFWAGNMIFYIEKPKTLTKQLFE